MHITLPQPLRAYHVTSTANLQSIRSQGLMPQVGPRSQQAGETQAAVYCFPDAASCEQALLGWLGECFEEDEPLCVLELLLPARLRAACEVGYEMAVLDPIPAQAILAVRDESGALAA